MDSDFSFKSIDTGKSRMSKKKKILIGANAVRLSHYQQNETVYEYCDKNGLIVICEVPFISIFLNTTQSELNLLNQLTEMVKQNFNHPYVALWGIMNEVGMKGESEDEYVLVRKLNERAKSLDESRQTYGAMLIATPPTSPLNKMPDVIGFNLYGGWYVGTVEFNGHMIDAIQKVEGNKPLSLTEYGAEAILKYHSDQLVSHDYSEEYQLIFHQKFYKIIEEKDLWGSFVWNMFDFASDLRDEGGVKGMNNKGLVSYDRKIKKESFYFYKSVWNNQDKFVHVCGTRFHDRATDDINVTIITGKAALKSDLSIYLNNKLIQKIDNNNENLIVVRVFLEDGKNVVKAVISDPSSKSEIDTDSVEFEKVKEPNPDYMFLNVTEIETKYPRPEGNYSVYDSFGDLQKSPQAWAIVSQMFADFDIDSFLPLIQNERFVDLLISTGMVSDTVIMMFAMQLAQIPKVNSLIT